MGLPPRGNSVVGDVKYPIKNSIIVGRSNEHLHCSWCRRAAAVGNNSYYRAMIFVAAEPGRGPSGR